jgi:hypothetical protein
MLCKILEENNRNVALILKTDNVSSVSHQQSQVLKN